MLAGISRGAWVGQFWNRPAAQVRTEVRRLEDAGHRVLWISESLGREVFSFAAVLLAATDRMVIATGIANLWVRDAAAMRNAARTLAEAHPDRFVLGIGVSHPPLVDRRGHDYGHPLAATRAYLEAMAAADARGPAPPHEPPVLVGALGDGMLRLSSSHADGAHPYLVTPQHTAHARQVLGPAAVLAPEQAVVLCSDAGPARAAARTHLATYLGLDNYVRSLRRQGFTDDDLADGGSDHLVDAIVAWGDVDAIEARLAEHLRAGADHVAVQALVGDGVPDPIDQLVALAPAP